jgi:CheY-like chemotaxis protein/HPt (histidine-containing phosphotransfer) domain-containing protein
MMGGTIGVDSREGRGSTFWFTVALALEPHGQSDASSERQKAPEAAPGIAWGGTAIRHDARILVAEDNATNRAVALAQLQKLGYQANAVINGAEAVEAVQRGRYDLVLMDCQMPVMDGFEATRLIRGSLQPGIAIVAMTADSMQGDRNRCLREGMNDFIAKPVDLGLLANMLAKWLPVTSAVGVDQALVVFDADGLLRRLMGDRRLAGIVLKGFVGDVPSQLSQLRQRLDEGDAAGARSMAHALKGAAATVSAEGLYAIALAMEESGQLDRCADLLPRLVEEFRRFKSAFELAKWQ